MRTIRLAGAALAALILLTGAPSRAATYQQDLTFTTVQRQSAWGPGPAQRVSDSVFLGDSWNARSPTIGGITGNVSRTRVPNPKYAAWLACRAGSLGFANCGRRPPQTVRVTIDSRTGATVSLNTTGTAGVELGFTVDAGSVGATVGFRPVANAPTTARAGQFFSIAPRSTVTGGTLDAQSPTVSAYADAVLKFDLDATGTGCIIFAGCSSSAGQLLDIDDQRELLSIDPGRLLIGDGFTPPDVTFEALLADLTASFGIDSTAQFFATVNNIPLGRPAVGLSTELANIKFTPPNVVSTGGAAGGVLRASGQDTILALNADLDALFGSPGGGSLTAGPFGLTLEGYDIEAGPTMSMFQDFRLVPKLMVDLAFDRPVEVAGLGLVTSLTSAWDALPSFAITGDTLFSPTFWVDAVLTSTTGLQFGLALTMDLFKGGISFGPLQGTFGPLVSVSAAYDPTFAKVSLFDDTFSFGGFAPQAGTPFLVRYAADDVPVVAPVPVPAAALLLGSALATLLALRRRRA